MKNLLSILVFLLCGTAVFGQFNPPEIYNYTSGDTVFEKIVLQLTHPGPHGEQRFFIKISKSDKFNLADDELIVHEKSSYVPLPNLLVGTTYFIKARIVSDLGFSQWSKPFEITVSDSVKMKNHRGKYQSQPLFFVDWYETYASTYKVQFDTVSRFNSPALVTDTASTASYIFTPNVLFSKIYYRVKPVNGTVEGEWTSPRLYTGFVEPSLSRPGRVYIFHASHKWFSINAIQGFNYHWQLSTDSQFSSIDFDTLSVNGFKRTNLDFDTDYYFRIAFEHKGVRSKWSYPSRYRFQGPELPFNADNEKLSRSALLYFSFLKDQESFDIEVAVDSLFQNSHKMYNGAYTDRVQFKSPFLNRRQFIRWRVHHKNDTSSWSSVVVLLDNIENSIFFNGVGENLFDVRFFAPNGSLSFDSYGTDFKKVWVEMDTSSSFNSDKKIALESDQKDVTVPDLYMGQTYFIRYRVAYNSGYEEKNWSHRLLAVQTLSRPEDRRDYSPTDYIVRNISIPTVTGFTGSVQFQLFSGRGIDKDSLRFDTLIDGYSTSVLLPFDTTARYRARLINKVDVSDWVVSSIKSYLKPKITLPLKGSTVTADSVSLEWQDTSSACKYTVQIDTQKLRDFQQGNVFDAEGDFPRIGVASGKTYYWRIKARTRMGSSAWSNISTFVTDVNRSIASLPKGAVKVYPNPVLNQLTVMYDGVSTVKLLNLQGQALLQVEGDGSIELNTGALATGIYILEVNTANGTYRQQIEKL